MSRYRTTMKDLLEQVRDTIDEGKMKDIYTMDQEGKPPKEIAKLLKLKTSVVKSILGEEAEDLQEFSRSQLDALARQYADLKDKTISIDQANKLRKIFDRIPDAFLNNLRKRHIPFLSGLALSRMIQKGMPVREEVLDEQEDVSSTPKEKKLSSEKEQPKDEKHGAALEKENERLIAQIGLIKQKLENEKNKVVKPKPNAETGQVPLTIGVAYKHFKDQEEKKEKKEETVKEKLLSFKESILQSIRKPSLKEAAKSPFPKQSDFNAIMRVVDKAIGDINRATKAFDRRFYGTTGNGITLDKEAFEDIKDELTSKYTDEFEESKNFEEDSNVNYKLVAYPDANSKDGKVIFKGKYNQVLFKRKALERDSYNKGGLQKVFKVVQEESEHAFEISGIENEGRPVSLNEITSDQITNIKKVWKDVKSVDPKSDKYKDLVTFLKKKQKKFLQDISKAGINFVSNIAKEILYKQHGIKESLLKRLGEKVTYKFGQIAKAKAYAKVYSGNMTRATKEIEKIAKGLSKDPEVAKALMVANEALDVYSSATSNKVSINPYISVQRMSGSLIDDNSKQVYVVIDKDNKDVFTTHNKDEAHTYFRKNFTELAPLFKVNEQDNAYAIGMAKAKEITGDEPPLKKSTIVKAHDIAKAIKKDKNEDLDENMSKAEKEKRLQRAKDMIKYYDAAKKQALKGPHKDLAKKMLKNEELEENATVELQKKVAKGGMDKQMFQKSVDLLKAKKYDELKKHLKASDTSPREYVMDLIAKKEPATFKKMYGNQTGYYSLMNQNEELEEAKAPFRLSYSDKYGKHAGFEDGSSLQDIQNKAQKLRAKGFTIDKMGRNTSPVKEGVNKMFERVFNKMIMRNEAKIISDVSTITPSQIKRQAQAFSLKTRITPGSGFGGEHEVEFTGGESNLMKYFKKYMGFTGKTFKELQIDNDSQSF